MRSFDLCGGHFTLCFLVVMVTNRYQSSPNYRAHTDRVSAMLTLAFFLPLTYPPSQAANVISHITVYPFPTEPTVTFLEK